MDMKRTLLTLALCLAAFAVTAREYTVRGPEGGLSFKIALPEGFDPQADRCPMAILKYVQRLTYVSEIGFLGHSQGGKVLLLHGTRRRSEVVQRAVAFFKEVFQ